ncbi:plasmid stabilization protein [Rhodobacteraceae bacterium HSP-20]|jgi:plasmid stability protein|uniref:Plasmid stabilization protein n=1 Tax=Paragemmobacter amnigenus TaxID=2852097 RepID=A0ABS6J3P1_9RHOB|nr:plasmid stabilization protein [Rhodobacter amnigenus]MBU9698137.1 plasmid stabilization protein [Rhodobacter amnigenus]MBV4389364.1 plasmid stabilization protein [Rhodobacter amnigenus]
MASIIIRNLEEDVKARLKLRAASRGHSMEEEARDILRRSVGAADPRADLGTAIAARFAALGVTLPPMQRGA